MVEVICAAIAALAAVVAAYVTTANSKNHKKAEKRAELSAKESRLMLDMIHANSRLTVGTALAIKRGTANGELEEGLRAVQECDEAYNEFIEKIAIEHLKK